MSLLHYSMYIRRGGALCCVNIPDYSASSDEIAKQGSCKNLGCFKLHLCLTTKMELMV